MQWQADSDSAANRAAQGVEAGEEEQALPPAHHRRRRWRLQSSEERKQGNHER